MANEHTTPESIITSKSDSQTERELIAQEISVVTNFGS